MPSVQWPLVLRFLALTFGVSWVIAGLFMLTGRPWAGISTVVVGVPYMFGPAIAAVLMMRHQGEAVLAPLEVRFNPNWGWIAAWLVPVGLSLAAMGVSLLMPGVTYSPGMEGLLARFAPNLSPEQLTEARAALDALPVHPVFLMLVQGLIAGVTINPLATFGEELGWRGWLHRALAPMGFWPRAGLTGVLWGLWHAPLILMGHNYPAHPQIGVAMMVVFCLLLSPIMSALRERSGSVLGAAIAHGSVNATAGLGLVLAAGGTDLTVGMTGAAGFIVLAVANVGVWLSRRSAAT